MDTGRDKPERSLPATNVEPKPSSSLDRPLTLIEHWQNHVQSLRLIARSRCTTAADAADAVQDTYYEAARCFHRFDPAKGSCEAWLIAILGARCADLSRRASVTARWLHRISQRISRIVFPAADEGADPVDPADSSARCARILNLLDPTERAIATALLEGKNQTEIAATMGTSQQRISSLIGRMKQIVGGELPDETRHLVKEPRTRAANASSPDARPPPDEPVH